MKDRYYITQAFNPNRHPLMPEGYVWQVSIGLDPPFGEGWVFATQAEIDAINASLATEVQAYFAALEAEQAQRDAFMQQIQNRVNRIQFGQELMVRFVTENDVVYGITEAQSLVMAGKLAGVAGLIGNGSLSAALQIWVDLEPDEILTQERIDAYASEIAGFLGVSVPGKTVASLEMKPSFSLASTAKKWAVPAGAGAGAAAAAYELFKLLS
jgi:hypothetical protein